MLDFLEPEFRNIVSQISRILTFLGKVKKMNLLHKFRKNYEKEH